MNDTVINEIKQLSKKLIDDNIVFLIEIYRASGYSYLVFGYIEKENNK